MDSSVDASVTWAPATPLKTQSPQDEEIARSRDGEESHDVGQHLFCLEQQFQANLLEANMLPTSHSNDCGKVGDTVYTFHNLSTMHGIGTNIPFCDLLALADAATSVVPSVSGFMPVTPAKGNLIWQHSLIVCNLFS